MRQEFFKNTNESKFISQIIKSTNIPIYETVDDGDYVINGVSYIYNNSIVECTKTGYLYSERHISYMKDTINKYNSDENSRPNLDEKIGIILKRNDIASVSENNTIILKDNFAKIIPKQNYNFNKNLMYQSYNYCTKNGFYDSETHRYLAKYLRMVRDIKGIDLLPFYNCFNYKSVDNFSLSKNSKNGYILEYDNTKKIFAIPIKFNQVYTIAIDSDSPVLLKSVILSELGLVRDFDYISEDTKYIADTMFENNFDTPQCIQISGSRFTKPFHYIIKNTEEYAKKRLNKKFGILNPSQEQIDKELRQLNSCQNQLYLIMQIDKNNKSSISVLEGEYYNQPYDLRCGIPCFLNMSIPHFLTADAFLRCLDFLTNKEINEQLISRLSLLRLNNGITYPYSNKLIEYLLKNVVDSSEELDNNVYNIKKELDTLDINNSSANFYYDNDFRAKVFYKLVYGCDIKDAESIKGRYIPDDIDLNGFSDKVIENVIGGEF